jgi:hypothetical protein
MNSVLAFRMNVLIETIERAKLYSLKMQQIY